MVGKPAPDFCMEGVAGCEFTQVSLADLKGKWVVLFFYPLDFTFVCPTEIREFSQRSADFAKLGAQVLGCSVDSKFSHLAWINADLGQLNYPLLSDITKQASTDYGVLLPDGIALRGTFIIDPEGVVQYEVCHQLSVGRNIEEALRVLEALQTGELCPVNWSHGGETLGKA